MTCPDCASTDLCVSFHAFIDIDVPSGGAATHAEVHYHPDDEVSVSCRACGWDEQLPRDHALVTVGAEAMDLAFPALDLS